MTTTTKTTLSMLSPEATYDLARTGAKARIDTLLAIFPELRKEIAEGNGAPVEIASADGSTRMVPAGDVTQALERGGTRVGKPPAKRFISKAQRNAISLRMKKRWAAKRKADAAANA